MIDVLPEKGFLVPKAYRPFILPHKAEELRKEKGDARYHIGNYLAIISSAEDFHRSFPFSLSRY
jgi:hypothetical protein